MSLRLVGIAVLPMVLACSRVNPAYGTNEDAGASGDSSEAGSASAGDVSAGSTTGLADSGSAEGTGIGEPVCGNGIPEGDEACDDGVNDGSYDGCTAECQLAAYCGDGNVDASSGEACDDGDDDLTDGCLPNCIVPRSCLEIRDSADAPADGVYIIHPDANLREPFAAYCDMNTDGGGYTFYKIELGASVFAPAAEHMCGEMGMQLFIPRTNAHRDSAWEVANDERFGPGADGQYLRIMGVYPQFAGATCPSQPLTSSNPDCDWRAGDDQVYWVDDLGLFNEPNGNDGATQIDASMRYDWDRGELTWYDDITGNGASSSRFMCQAGDKF